MPYKIAIASGKGGTGKTSVSVSLFLHLQKHSNQKITLVDCDVEEPNDLIFLPQAQKSHQQTVSQLIPQIDTEKCTFCRKCSEYCEFNAIVVIPTADFAEVNASLCHSCGACLLACQHNAITEQAETIGTANLYTINDSAQVAEGRLKIGSAMQTMLINKLKQLVPDDNDIYLFDSPPGTSCPVVASIADTDYVILVAEPTPFGLYDLKLMVTLLKELKKDYGLIINKAGLGNDEIYQYAQNENIELLGEIPFEKDFAGNYAKGLLTEHGSKSINESYEKITQTLLQKIQQS